MRPNKIIVIFFTVGTAFLVVDTLLDIMLPALRHPDGISLIFGAPAYTVLLHIAFLLLCALCGVWLKRAFERQASEYSQTHQALVEESERSKSTEANALKALEYERDLLLAFMDNSIDYIYFKDRESRFIRVNRAWAKTWGGPAGHNPDKIIGRTDFDFFPKEAAQAMFNDEQEILRTGRPLLGKEEVDVPINSTDRAWVSTIKMPLRDREGRIIGTFGVSRDITDLKQAHQALEKYKNRLEDLVRERTSQLEHDISRRREVEDQLRESQENLAITLASIGDAVIATDANGHVTRLNSVAENLTGWSASEAQGKKLAEICPLVNQSTRAPISNPFERALQGASVTAFSREAVLLNKKGREISISGNASPIRGKDGTIVGLVVVFRDITEQRLLERQLRQAERMQAIGQLAGGVAHDFNNQVTGIVGCAEMLRMLSKDQETLRYVNMIMTAAGRSSDLTAKLLAFARRGTYQSVPVDIHKVINEVVALLEHTIDRRIHLKLNLEAEVATVTGDPTQIQNALLNIALNARDALPDGGEILFSTRVVVLDQGFIDNRAYGINPGRYVEAMVTDTGIGMSEETQAHLFEPFFTTKKDGKGTGMGLAAVYGTVKSHRGAVGVYSEIGRGSTFKIYLPLLEDQESQRERVLEAPIKGSATILVIDDEEVVRNIVRDMLTSLGYKVRICKSGKEALQSYADVWREIDLVILDMVMPDLSGRDTFLGLVKINPKVKVLLSSGYSMNQSVQDVIDEGAKTFLQKPFLLHDLARKIADVL